jgi:membrane-associated phospholipid phosphatase
VLLSVDSIACLSTPSTAGRGARIEVRTIAVLIPIFVAFSRMYRSMHHPTDVPGGGEDVAT